MESKRWVYIPDEGNIHFGQSLSGKQQNFLRKFRRAEAHKRVISIFLAENRHRVHLPAQLTGQKQAEQIPAENGGFSVLFPQKPPLFGAYSETKGSGFQFPDGNALPYLVQLALFLTGRFTGGAQNMGKGSDFVIKRQRPVKISPGDGGDHGLGVQLQGTGGVAVGRLLVDTQVLDGFQLLLGEHPFLAVNMG